MNQNKVHQGLRWGAWVLCGAVALSACSKGQEGAEQTKPTDSAKTEAQAPAPVPLTVQVTGAWIRPAVQGQKATGAYLTLTANQAARLMGGSSPVAKTVELHEMKMDGDVMRMRKVEDGLELKADLPVTLKPGAYHLMLLDLTQPLVDGQEIDLTLSFASADGSKQDMPTRVKVKSVAHDEEAQPEQHEEHHH